MSAFIRTGQIYEFKGIRIKVIIHDSYYELREMDGNDRFNMYSFNKKDWLYFLAWNDLNEPKPMSMEEFKRIHLSISITEWVEKHKFGRESN